MISVLIIIFAGSGVCSVVQNPPDLIKNQDEIAEIKCAHTVKSYERILWYKHSQETGFTLMGYLSNAYAKPEEEFQNKIKLIGDGSKDGTLTINNVSVSDSAVYYCAAYYTVL
ncbi:hypothetical protein KOW79_008487 [Hemibagrus wyckioides]|uniref:Ig-like domain-containing protein n=1 Tax=Hemibagrus wyckioides TaxID=337641 RepID=A0A9D3NWD5_9TELE|nr:hypothetical protein KOW79_008487 [Hemibagrus wyckioides]